MAKKPLVEDDIFVRRETILSYFAPSPSRSTFFDWVNKGLVVPAGGSRSLKGYYKLNETLARLDMPQVDVVKLRKEKNLGDEYKRMRSLYLTTLAIFVEEIFLANDEEPADHLTPQEIENIALVYKVHQPYLDPAATPFTEEGMDFPLTELKERLDYCSGVLNTLKYKFKK